MAEPIKIEIFSKSQKNSKGITYRRFWTYMKLKVAGEEDKGKQKKSITVKFRQGVDTKNIKRGYLYLTDYNAPFKYEIKKDENNNDKYPELWVRKIDKYEEKLSSHSQNDFITDEEETEEFTSTDSNNDSVTSDGDLPF